MYGGKLLKYALYVVGFIRWIMLIFINHVYKLRLY